MKARHSGVGLLAVGVTLALTACSSGLGGGDGTTTPPTTSTTPTTTAATTVKPLTSYTFGGPTNLIPNGSFEGGAAPWTPFSGSQIAASRTSARFGKASLLLKPLRVETYFGAQVGVIAYPPRGARYEFSAWVRGGAHSTVGSGELKLVADTPKGQVILGSSKVPLKTGWQHLTIQGTVRPRTTSTVEAQVYFSGSVTVFSSALVDGVVVQQVHG